MIQRLQDPLGKDEVIDWTPSGDVALADQSGKGAPGGDLLNFGGGDTATFNVPARDLTAKLNFPVVANWHPAGTPPSPGPGPAPGRECDPCTILQNSASQALRPLILTIVNDVLPFPFSFFLSEPITEFATRLLEPLLHGAFKILPDSLVRDCKTLKIDEIIERVRNLRIAALEQKCAPLAGTGVCDVINGIQRAVNEGCVVPIVCGPVKKAVKDVRDRVFKVVSDALGVVLRQLQAEQKKCKGPQPPTPKAGGSGTATSTLRTTVFRTADGQVHAVGPPPAQNVNGTGATEVTPVSFSHDGTPNSALITQVPEIQADGTDGAKTSHQFTVNVNYAAPPSPVPFRCAREGFDGDQPGFFPFRVAKPEFEDEGSKVTEIHQFFHGLNPRTKASLHRGEGSIDIVGFASRTGSVAFNTALSEKRAEHVDAELHTAAGSDSHLITEGRGFLAAKLPGEEGRERRADVIASGTLTGDDALAVGNSAACCVGGKIDDPVSSDPAQAADSGAPQSETEVAAPADVSAAAPVAAQAPPLEEAEAVPSAETAEPLADTTDDAGGQEADANTLPEPQLFKELAAIAKQLSHA